MTHLIAEVPVAPVIPALALEVIGLVAFLGFLVATGMLKAYSETLGALLRKLASIIDVAVPIPHITTLHPLRGVSHTLYALDTQIRNGFAWLALKSQAGAAWAFTTAGTIFEWTGREIADLARDVGTALGLQRVVTIPRVIRAATAETLTRLRGIDHTLGRLEAQAHALERRLLNGIDRLTHTVTATLPHEIAGLSGRVGATVRQLRRLARRTTRLERLLGAGAFAAAVGVALERMGLRWLRCPSLLRAGRKIGCGGFSLLEDLLALSVDAFLVTDLCSVVTAMTKAARLFAGELDYLASQIGGLIRCQGATRPARLPVAWYEPPQVVSSLEL